MNYHNLVSNLEVAGFFDTASVGSNRTSIKQDILNSEHRYLFPDQLGRSFFADAEDLAEQGVLEFIAELAPQLARREVYLPVIEVPLRPVRQRHPTTGEIIEVARTKLRIDGSIPDPPGVIYLRPAKEELPESGEYYRVSIGSRTREIWNNRMDGGQMWEAGMCHSFILINQLLEDAGAEERLYGLYGGNDGLAVFLTPTQFGLIRIVWISRNLKNRGSLMSLRDPRQSMPRD